MFTCIIRYEVYPDKLSDFKDYAQAWIELITDYSGTHHGYFCPPTEEEQKNLPDPTFSFPGLGSEGPPNKGFALFSFETLEKYETYKRDVAEDDRCTQATDRFKKTNPFLSYERNFLTPIFK